MEISWDYNVNVGIQRGKFMGIGRMGWENLEMLWGPVCLLNVVTLRFEFSALKIDVEQQGSPKNVMLNGDS